MERRGIPAGVEDRLLDLEIVSLFMNRKFIFTKHDPICVAWYDRGTIIRNLEECVMIRHDIFGRYFWSI